MTSNDTIYTAAPDADRARLALVIAVKARNNAETDVHQAIHQAREWGWSWTDIAKELGVSRQAAWERYSKVGDDAPDAGKA